MDQKPHLLKKMHEFASHELSLARDHMMLLGRLSAEEKIAAFVWRMRQRWARVESHAKLNVPLPMSRQDIADYLGLTIETVSRTINHLQRDRRLIIVPGGIRILTPNFFEDISSE
jgi:CRP/FNR family transcriptional regulator